MKKILNEWRKFLLKEAAPTIPFNDEYLEKKSVYINGLMEMKNII